MHLYVISMSVEYGAMSSRGGSFIMHLDQSNDWGDRVCSCGESSVTPHSVIKEDVLVGTWGRYLGTWEIPDSVDKQDVWVIGEYT